MLRFAKRIIHTPPSSRPRHWVNPVYNMAWDNDEIERTRYFQPKHAPRKSTDKLFYYAVRGAYHGFNFVSGYNRQNPSGKACVFRLVFLESIAGVPGMVGASVRHFKSLRNLKRDHGWIHTLLEEAENERMHLLTVMSQFEASKTTRFLVAGAQFTLLPFLTSLALINPKYVHRFVGYLEETAVHTYSDLIEKVETPGTKLNKEWGHLKAPQIAIDYWRLPEDSMWIDCLKQMMADEANHRDVNHTFAGLDATDTNPFIAKHHKSMMQVADFMHRKDIWIYEKDALREDKSYLKCENRDTEVLKDKEKMIEMFSNLMQRKNPVTVKNLMNELKREHVNLSAKFLRTLKKADLNEDGIVSPEEWKVFLETYKSKFS